MWTAETKSRLTHYDGSPWPVVTERFERQTTIALAGAEIEPLGDGWEYDGAGLHEGNWIMLKGEHTPGRVVGAVWAEGKDGEPFVWQKVQWKRRIK